MKYLKIPKERIGVLIGHNGETKKSKRSCLIIIVIILTLILCVLCVGVGYGILKSGSQIFPEELSNKLPDSFSLEPETEAPTENDLPLQY